MLDVMIQDKICFLEMRNEDRLNCLSEKLCQEIIDGLNFAYSSECVGVVIAARTNKGVWSAGHDIKELPTGGGDPLAYDVPMEKMLRKIQDLPIPVIAYVTGTVWGGACDLCLSCDMIVSVDTATFAITPAKLGIPYNASGIMHFINQLGINKAREMFFTANPITAQDALNVGLLNHIAPAEELEQMINEKILNPLRKNSILSISAIKRQFRVLSQSTSVVSSENFEMVNNWREKVFRGPDYSEGVRSFLEKRSPNYKGKAKDLDVE